MDYVATLPRVAVSRTLWLIVAWPLVGLAWQVLVARLRVARARDAGAVLDALASARVAGLGCIALAATATVGHALLLARMPAGARALFEPIARGARFGDVDAGVELLLDARGLAACALACATTLGAAVVLARRPAPQRGWRQWAWLQLALAGALVSLLGDGFLTVAMGWALAAAAGAWLAGWHDVGAGIVVATRGAVALATLIIGAALLFWGLGGSWDDEGYLPESRPPLVAVHAAVGAGEASITMTSLAGAAVYLDESRASALRSPFVRIPLAAGPHAIRVHPGDGTGDVVLPHVEVAAGEEIALVRLGPTLSFHTMADELTVLDRGAPGPAQQHVGPGGFAVVAGALLALLGAAGAMSAWSQPMAAPRALVGAAAGATTSALGPFLLARMAFLFPSAPHTGIAVASVGAAIVLAVIWNALGYVGVRRWLVFAGGAPPGLTLVALGLEDVVASLGVMVVSGMASAAVYFAAAVGGDDDVAADQAARRSLDGAMLLRLPARLGELVASMERWVVSAAASAVGAAARIAAWMVATADNHLVATPADAVATRVERAARTVEPWVGVPLARAAWALLAALALAALVHAAWPGG